MPTSHKNKSNYYTNILDQLLKSGDEIESNRATVGNSLDSDIERMNATTRNRNSARDSQFRSKIAMILTWSFVLMLGAIIVLIPVFNATIGATTQIDIYRLLEAFGSVFGTVLGFVLGYYFKAKHGGID